MTLYSRLDALLKARPKTMAAALVAFTATAFLLNPVIPAWITGVMHLPVASLIAVMVWKRGSGAEETEG